MYLQVFHNIDKNYAVFLLIQMYKNNNTFKFNKLLLDT